MQSPNIIINIPAMLTAAVAAFFFGFLWYGPLFGKIWAGLMGMKMDQKPDPKVMRQAFILQIIGLLLTTYVVMHTVQVWRPSVWNAGTDSGSNFAYGLMHAFFTWLGFYVPHQFGKIAWEGRPWKLFFINSGHDFCNLLLISVILSYWR